MSEYIYSVFSERTKRYDYYTSKVKPELYLRSDDSRLHSFLLMEDLRVPLPEDAKFQGQGVLLRGAAATSQIEPVFFNPSAFAVTVFNVFVISTIVGWINNWWRK